jgi:hypothetical protein
MSKCALTLSLPSNAIDRFRIEIHGSFFQLMVPTTMRRIIHIPVIHTSADLGSLSEVVRAHYTKVCGRTGWNQREQIVRALWTDIRKNLDALHLDGPKTRIYQDGLPLCGFEERIVRELADAGSSNHQLILRLLDQGAILMGTEDPQLLMEEYELQKQNLECKAGEEYSRVQWKKRADRLLEARDAFIAKRIEATLLEGETGLLFLGALHRLATWKATDILIESLGGVSNETVRRPGA